MLLNVLYVLLAVGVLIAPLPLIGRRIERRRREAGLEAVAAAGRRLATPALPPARPITMEEELDALVAEQIRVPQRRTVRVLDRLEERWQSGLDEILARAFDALGLDETDRAWALVSTGEHRALQAA